MRTIAVAVLCALALAVGGPASATDPIDVPGQITDQVGAIDDLTAVQSALDDLFESHGVQLFVVYVDDFGGLDGSDWASRTAEKSGLSEQDVLLAVATEERSYGLDAGEAISSSQLETISRQQVLPALRDSDWVGAATGAAAGIDDALDGSGFPWAPVAAGGVVVLGGGAAIHLLRRRRRRPDSTGDLDSMSIEELDRAAGSALVAIDDALATSEQELGFAQAQFGEQATAEFSEVLAHSRTRVAEAFRLRQALDDETSDSDDDRRSMAAQIVAICREVDLALDAQVESFDSLRDFHEHVPEVLADLGRRIGELSARIPATTVALTSLRERHRATSLASIDGNVDQASALLASASSAVDRGLSCLADTDRSVAVAEARAAEGAVAQAATLLDAVDRADQDIATAQDTITARLDSLGTDLADADRLAAGDAAVREAARTATAAINAANSPDRDPLAVAAALDAAEARLDDLLEPLRAQAAEAQKARNALRDSLGRVTSRIAAVSDYIATRRGAVGTQARTRLAEAARHLDQAQRQIEADPTAAQRDLERAESLAAEAERLAHDDVIDWERRSRPTAPGGGLDSMILGGVLVNAATRGPRRPGSSRGGGLSPGSFGGSRTRTRHSTGGRF